MPFLDRRRVTAAFLIAAANGSLIMGIISAATPAHAQFGGIVFDPRNYAQNILTAARTLQAVNQQIRQLQNEAQMLVAMGKNLSRIDFPQLMLRSLTIHDREGKVSASARLLARTDQQGKVATALAPVVNAEDITAGKKKPDEVVKEVHTELNRWLSTNVKK